MLPFCGCVAPGSRVARIGASTSTSISGSSNAVRKLRQDSFAWWWRCVGSTLRTGGLPYIRLWRHRARSRGCEALEEQRWGRAHLVVGGCGDCRGERARNTGCTQCAERSKWRASTYHVVYLEQYSIPLQPRSILLCNRGNYKLGRFAPRGLGKGGRAGLSQLALTCLNLSQLALPCPATLT